MTDGNYVLGERARFLLMTQVRWLKKGHGKL